MYMSPALIWINTVVYIAIAGKFGEVKVRQISLFEHLMKKVWRILGHPKGLLIVSNNSDGFSLVNHGQFVKSYSESPNFPANSS